jgi:hypothetical protein
MGHNSSNRKRSSTVMRAPLSEYADWHLVLDCAGLDCPRMRAYDVAALAGLYPDETVAGVIRRLRCSTCACSPAVARMRQKQSGRGRVEDIALVGPGSF